MLVVECKEQPYNGKWFYVDHGIKNWITSLQAAIDNHIDLSKIHQISSSDCAKYSTGKMIVIQAKSIDDIQNTYDARAFFLNDIHGNGIEFGAAVNPCTIPDKCVVKYADYFESNEGCNEDFQGDFVPISYYTSLDKMDGINDRSVDFLIACHVIEHVPRTLLALKKCYEKLKVGGTLFLVVPHMEYTFDMYRHITRLEHFVGDYEHYVKERDMIHVVDHIEHFAEYEERTKGIKRKKVDLFPLLENFLSGGKVDVHYHTFTEKSFTELMDYFNTNIATWSKTEIISRIPFTGSNEFYVKLVK